MALLRPASRSSRPPWRPPRRPPCRPVRDRHATRSAPGRRGPARCCSCARWPRTARCTSARSAGCWPDPSAARPQSTIRSRRDLCDALRRPQMTRRVSLRARSDCSGWSKTMATARTKYQPVGVSSTLVGPTSTRPWRWVPRDASSSCAKCRPEVDQVRQLDRLEVDPPLAHQAHDDRAAQRSSRLSANPRTTANSPRPMLS